MTEDEDPPLVVPLSDEIDLHSFAPADIPSVVEEYLAACAARGLQRVRIVHGRGRGVQRAVVHGLLARLEGVLAFEDAPPELGGWGATLVVLRPPSLP